MLILLIKLIGKIRMDLRTCLTTWCSKAGINDFRFTKYQEIAESPETVNP